MKIENYWYLIYFSGLRNTQSSCNFFDVLSTVSVIIFSDIIFHFAVYCFSSVKGFFGRITERAIRCKALTLEYELNYNLSEAYLERSRTSMMELFGKIVYG